MEEASITSMRPVTPVLVVVLSRAKGQAVLFAVHSTSRGKRGLRSRLVGKPLLAIDLGQHGMRLSVAGVELDGSLQFGPRFRQHFHVQIRFAEFAVNARVLRRDLLRFE